MRSFYPGEANSNWNKEMVHCWIRLYSSLVWHAQGKDTQGVKCPKALQKNRTAAVVPCLSIKSREDLHYGDYLNDLLTSASLLK